MRIDTGPAPFRAGLKNKNKPIKPKDMTKEQTDRLVAQAGEDIVQVCSRCGSADIELRAWVQDTGERTSIRFDEAGGTRCLECGTVTEITGSMTAAAYSEHMHDCLTASASEEARAAAADWGSLTYPERLERFRRHFNADNAKA